MKIIPVSLSPVVDKVIFVENLEVGKEYRTETHCYPCGKAVCVARVLSILGEAKKTFSIGFKAGVLGDWIEKELQLYQIKTNFIKTPGETRTTTNIIDRKSGSMTVFRESPPYISPENMIRFLDLYKRYLVPNNIFLLSGRLPPGIPVDFYGQLIEMANAIGSRTILDTSGQALKEGIKAKPNIIKPNLAELCDLAGRELHEQDEIVYVCRDIISQGVEIIITSLGENGALLITKDEVLYSRPPEVSALNPAGSGDSMVAGLAVGMSRGYPLKETFRLGMACGVANTLHTEVGLVDIETVKELLCEIDIITL